MGQLYYGDNLEFFQRNIKDESDESVYLDPPAPLPRGGTKALRS